MKNCVINTHTTVKKKYSRCANITHNNIFLIADRDTNTNGYILSESRIQIHDIWSSRGPVSRLSPFSMAKAPCLPGASGQSLKTLLRHIDCHQVGVATGPTPSHTPCSARLCVCVCVFVYVSHSTMCIVLCCSINKHKICTTIFIKQLHNIAITSPQ